MKKINSYFLYLSGASLLAFSGNAKAEEVNAESNSSIGLEEIIVTGEKRETAIQRAPLSITAIDSAALQERNVNEVNDLNGLVPGLSISKNEGSSRIVAIRGIGYETSANPNSQPGVAFHINGVYIAHVMSLAQDMIDVERVEVLRGPQGTVFGQTSTGGAAKRAAMCPSATAITTMPSLTVR